MIGTTAVTGFIVLSFYLLSILVTGFKRCLLITVDMSLVDFFFPSFLLFSIPL